MTRDKWKDLIEGAGVFAIVASLIFVGWQVRQERQIAGAELVSASDMTVLELSKFVHENREIWAKGIMGEELSEFETISFHAMAATYDQFMSGRNFRGRRLDLLSPGNVARNYALALYSFPGLRLYFKNKIERRKLQDSAFGTDFASDSTFRTEIQKYLIELERNETPRLESKSYILW